MLVSSERDTTEVGGQWFFVLAAINRDFEANIVSPAVSSDLTLWAAIGSRQRGPGGNTDDGVE
jgi:hypothetical protein